VVVWAGSFDLYSILQVQDASPEEEYAQVVQQLQARLEEDFGVGSALMRRGPQEYDISVEKVIA